MNRFARTALLFVAILTTTLQSAFGLIMVGLGNDPVTDRNWPAGTLDVANLKTRVGYWEGPPFGGGEYHFLYRGESKAFQDALDRFAKIRAPGLQLVIHDGPENVTFLKNEKDPKSDTRVDWAFVVWDPRSWNQLYAKPDNNWNADDPNFHGTMPQPHLELYIGRGGVDWPAVKLPEGITVVDERADVAGFKGGSAIIGDIYDMITSKPVAGATLNLRKHSGEKWELMADIPANDDGHVELTKLEAGSYMIEVRAAGYASRLIEYATLRGNTLRRFTTKLSPSEIIAGAVTDTNGKPLAGVEIHARGIQSVDGRGYTPADKVSTTTDENGRFKIEGLPRGFARVIAFGRGYQLLDSLKLHAIPSDNIALKMTATGTVRGKLLGAEGKPITDRASIHINPPGPGSKIGTWGGSMNVHPDGTFEFDNVPPGKYMVTADANAAITGTPDANAKTVEVKAGETVEVEIRGR